MKNSQQRLFFQAATSNRSLGSNRTATTGRFRPCGWIAVILALLFTSCTTLTPDRISVLAQIAGQAAQIGAQQWLAQHPEQRPAFDLVLAAISDFVRQGKTNMVEYTELLSSLPTGTLRGDAGELYISDTLVVWDRDLGRSTRIVGAAERPVRMAVRDGLRRAVAPMPPALPKWGFQNAKPAPVLGLVPESPDREMTDAELDAEFEAIKARLKARGK